ncbi:hypothetical protein CHI10_01295 [Bacillus sp. 7894-2]|nr:hypothetical protein CHI10_01295 [Bacillus sp. 7894-2]
MLREETAENYPELGKTLNLLNRKISDDEIREMNYKVNVEGASPEETAKEYLEERGIA